MSSALRVDENVTRMHDLVARSGEVDFSANESGMPIAVSASWICAMAPVSPVKEGLKWLSHV